MFAAAFPLLIYRTYFLSESEQIVWISAPIRMVVVIILFVSYWNTVRYGNVRFG